MGSMGAIKPTLRRHPTDHGARIEAIQAHSEPYSEQAAAARRRKTSRPAPPALALHRACLHPDRTC